MNPMTHLVLAMAVFLITHLVPSTALRGKLTSALGTGGYLLLYSAVAFATLGWAVWAYYHAPFLRFWNVHALRYVPLLAMPVAMVLIACSVLTPNPALIGQERLLEQENPARGILRVTRHPMMWGIAIWSMSHALARGDAAALVFFGSFLLLALAGTALIDRRKRSTLGAGWQRFAAETSNLPFLAIFGGRNQFKPAEIGWLRLLAGIILFAVVLLLHSTIFGVSPF